VEQTGHQTWPTWITFMGFNKVWIAENKAAVSGRVRAAGAAIREDGCA
jgi:hypothetical protein